MPTSESTAVFGDQRLPPWFWKRIAVSASGCWEWNWTKNPKGYGIFSIHGHPRLVHRFVYAALVGPIPVGLQLDHLCRVRNCVNVGHLEPVTGRENILRGVSPSAACARKTSCLRGHPLHGENLDLRKNGKRRCKACRRLLRE